MDFPLEYARVTGRLDVDGLGFRVRSGNITGYLTANSVGQMLDALRNVCVTTAGLPLCALLQGQLQRPNHELVEDLMAIIGGWDAHISPEGYPRQCGGETDTVCNAIGACIIFESEGTTVQGIFDQE